MPRKQSAPSLLTTAQAAAHRGVNASRIRQLILAGRLRAEKRGRDWLIAVADLDGLRSLPPGRKAKGA